MSRGTALHTLNLALTCRDGIGHILILYHINIKFVLLKNVPLYKNDRTTGRSN